MWNIDVSSREKDHDMSYIVIAGDQIKLFYEQSKAIEARNVDGAQLIGTVVFDSIPAGDYEYDEYERKTLEHAEKLLNGTQYFTIENEALTLTKQGLEQVPDGRAIFL